MKDLAWADIACVGGIAVVMVLVLLVLVLLMGLSVSKFVGANCR